MNRRDALKTFAAVAAGGSLPVDLPIDQHDPAVAITEEEIIRFLNAVAFDPLTWVTVRKIEESLP